jgi:alkylation response protein AidB-like acyl-CoA dehydrogenase
MLIPEQWDGLGLDATSYLLALEEIAVADASAAVLMSVHNSLPTQMLLNYGSDAQRSASSSRWRAASCSAPSRSPSPMPAAMRRAAHAGRARRRRLAAHRHQGVGHAAARTPT